MSAPQFKTPEAAQQYQEALQKYIDFCTSLATDDPELQDEIDRKIDEIIEHRKVCQLIDRKLASVRNLPCLTLLSHSTGRSTR